MNKKAYFLRVLVGLLVLLMAAPPSVMAQSSTMGAPIRQEELDQMFAPIALYPDALLGQILVAATYPEQVTEADQWLRQNDSLQGDQLNAALDGKDWDLSVKALVPFPKVLSMMSDKQEWTQRMGEVFLAREADVMDTIQRLRGKAHAQGNLETTEYQKVVVRGESIEILPANPRVIYVPTYNPTVIYGSWWYPAYPPYAYNPYYPNYAYDPYYTGAGFVTAGLFGFATGIAVGSIWHSGWGRWDWNRRNVNINVDRHYNINRNDHRRRDIRTTSWNRAVRDGRVGSSRHRDIRHTQGVRTRPTAGSVERGLQQRQSRDGARGRQNVQGATSRTQRSKRQAVRGDTTGSRQPGRRDAVQGTAKSNNQQRVRSATPKSQRGEARISGQNRRSPQGPSMQGQSRRATPPQSVQGRNRAEQARSGQMRGPQGGQGQNRAATRGAERGHVAQSQKDGGGKSHDKKN
ncbi:MAG: DUF3300 domain-containing protein [Syntrophobacteraceae bacterium]